MVDAFIIVLVFLVLAVLLIMFLPLLVYIGFQNILKVLKKRSMTEDEKTKQSKRTKEEALREQLDQKLEDALLYNKEKMLRTTISAMNSLPRRQDTKKDKD